MGVGAARGLEIVGPKADPTDASDESSALLALLLEPDRESDRNPTKTVATERDTVMTTIATQHNNVEDRQRQRRI